MKLKSLVIFLLLCKLCNAQYYYNDIVAPRQAIEQNALLKKNNIHTVTAKSTQGNETDAPALSIEQTIEQNGNLVITRSTDATGVQSYTSTTFKDGKIISNTDSSTNVLTHVNYSYTPEGNVQTISTISSDAFMSSHLEEQHQWFYSNNKPHHMLRIKDHHDTTYIQLSYDEKGNVAEEKWIKAGRTLEHWYYYYDEAGRLSDIVRYNLRVKKMLPDFLFEYNSNGTLVQTIQVPAGMSNYLIWQYSYNDRGLRSEATCLNKQKQVVGKIQYSYQ